ncbi:MAG: hypothetical protein RML12_11535, partial [Xanthomonadales bacterium]|nr:hypothetical protein [Xanthomonadales bacterium]
MRELLEQGAVEELSALKVERDRLRERLARLEGLQGDVDPRVAQRVAADYRQRLAEVDRRAQPLLERARQAYATLRGRLEELAQRHESIRLDREEIELRHRLGEFDDQARRERLAAIESALAEAQAARSEGEALRERFLAAVDEEAVLLVATPSASSVPRPAETARPTETARPAETARPTEPRTQPIRVVQPAPDAGKPPTRPMPT